MNDKDCETAEPKAEQPITTEQLVKAIAELIDQNNKYIYQRIYDLEQRVAPLVENYTAAFEKEAKRRLNLGGNDNQKDCCGAAMPNTDWQIKQALRKATRGL